MVEYVPITPGSGANIAADDLNATSPDNPLWIQRVKVVWGPDGTGNDADTASGKPMPVQLRSSTGTDLIGTAGSASAAVLSVQGHSSGTAVTVSGTVSLTDISNAEYETVAASATAQALGASGASGDYLSGVLIVPATTSPGSVTLYDGSSSPDVGITIFTGGASSLSNLVPFFVPLGIKSVSGAWKLTTGANVSCIGVGNFT